MTLISFKIAIQELRKEGNDIYITFRERGMIEEILKYEFANYKIIKIGIHHKYFVAKVIYQLLRDLIFIRLLKKHKINLVVCFGSTSAIASKIMCIPYLAFDDDFEYKIPFYLANIFSTMHIYPDYIIYKNKRTLQYHGFKRN